MMKRINQVLLSTLLMLVLSSLKTYAQDIAVQEEADTLLSSKINIFTAMPFAVVYQDSVIQRMMEDYAQGIQRGGVEVQGWRVQLYSSNNQLVAKQEAEQLKTQLESIITEPIYINFYQPFWKVRVGNFRTMEEAKEYREQLIKQIPELEPESYPVRENIIVVQ